MTTYTGYVTFDQQRAAYDALGLDPEQFKHTASIAITPHEVTVVRYLTNDNGRHYLGDDGEIVSETRVLPVAELTEAQRALRSHVGRHDQHQREGL